MRPLIGVRPSRCSTFLLAGALAGPVSAHVNGCVNARSDICNGRSLHHDAGIAPGLNATRRIADPRVSHAQARHECQTPVHDDALAVIAADPAERTVETRRVETANLHAALRQVLPESAARGPAGAPPVVHHPYAHTGGRSRAERVRELFPDRVVVNDVGLEVDAGPRLRDRPQPEWIIFAGVPQQTDPVPGDRARSGRARERLVQQLVSRDIVASRRSHVSPPHGRAGYRLSATRAPRCVRIDQ